MGLPSELAGEEHPEHELKHGRPLCEVEPLQVTRVVLLGGVDSEGALAVLARECLDDGAGL